MITNRNTYPSVFTAIISSSFSASQHPRHHSIGVVSVIHTVQGTDRSQQPWRNLSLHLSWKAPGVSTLVTSPGLSHNAAFTCGLIAGTLALRFSTRSADATRIPRDIFPGMLLTSLLVVLLVLLLHCPWKKSCTSKLAFTISVFTGSLITRLRTRFATLLLHAPVLRGQSRTVHGFNQLVKVIIQYVVTLI